MVHSSPKAEVTSSNLVGRATQMNGLSGFSESVHVVAGTSMSPRCRAMG
jgi:hypothetical protein